MQSIRKSGIHAIVALCVVSLAIGAGSVSGRAQNAPKKAFEPADWYRVKTLSAPAMSPDGKLVAVQVTSVDETANTRVNEIWVASAVPGGGEPVRFTAPGVDSTNPRFSDDGTLLMFTSTRPGYAGTQWAVRMDRPGGEFQYRAPAGEAAGGAGRGGGGGPGAGSRPKDGSFAVMTGVEGASSPQAGRGATPGGRGRGDGPAATPPGAPAPGAPDAPAPGGQGARGRGASGNANDPYTDMPVMARPPSTAITLPLDPERFDGMHITDMRYKANGRGFVPSTGRGGGGGAGRGGPGGRGGGGAGGGDNQPPQQILIDKLDGSPRKALTSAPYSHRSANVSPDGKWIAFLADSQLRSDADVRTIRNEIAQLGSNEERTAATTTRLPSDLFVIPVSGGAPKRIATPGNEQAVTWSPDSRFVSFTADAGQFVDSHVYVADVQAGTSRSLTSDIRGDATAPQWLPTGELLLPVTVGGRNALYRIDPKSGERKEIIGGRRRVFGYTYDTARTKVAYVATSADTPTELFVSNLDGTGERQLTTFNAEVNAAVAWAPAERFTYKSVGDVEIEAWLVKPYGYEPGRKYPLVLYIHGGPHSAYTEGWFDEFQNLAGAGMWVLFTNPRGSSGYGRTFTYMTRAKWGDEDYQDLMKAVDIAAARPDVDPERLGVTGGSYGGFMTAWITTKTTRFKAAQADRMIANWVSWYGISDAQSLTEGEFLGTPWQEWERYIDLSPIKYADKVKTPTLIVQSEEDHRTPMADAEQWFMALQKHNVPVEFVRYPRSNHDLSRTGEPWLLTDRLHRIRQWFGYWLKDEKPARPGAR